MKEVEGEDRGGSLCSKFQGRRRRGQRDEIEGWRDGEGKAMKGQPAPRWPQSPLSEGRTDGGVDDGRRVRNRPYIPQKRLSKGRNERMRRVAFVGEGLPPPPLVSGRESGHNGIAP